MKNILETDVIKMVEVTEDSEEVFELLLEYGFQIFTEDKKRIRDVKNVDGNIFCIKEINTKINSSSPL